MCSVWAENCIKELDKEKIEAAQTESSFAQKSRDELVKMEGRIDKLLDLHLDGSLSQTEYAAKKHKLILAKKDLEEKIHAFERKSKNRFELMIQFIKDANQAENIALQENPVLGRDFLKKIGSNFRIAERTLSLDFKNAWKIAAKYNAARRSHEATSSQNAEFTNWRRGWDSNPRILADARFPSACTRPLCDLS